jgi:threonine dehydrogenase-like Zn-dependent dehydrogenase
VNLLALLIQEQSIVGTFGYAPEFTEASDLICSGAVDVSPLISRTVSLGELPATFEGITQDRNRDQKVLVRP